jgi:hypothetical protein
MQVCNAGRCILLGRDEDLKLLQHPGGRTSVTDGQLES